MLKLRRLLAALILIAVLALVIVIWRHVQSLNPAEILESLPEQVDLSLEELHYTHNEEGKRSWMLDAAKAEYRREEGLALLDAVELTLFEAGRFKEINLAAKHGSLQQEEQLVEVWGDVVVTTGSGEKLYTDRLFYDGGQRLLRTAESVRVIGPRFELTGRGLAVDVTRGHLTLEDDVWMLLLPKERKGEGDE